MNRQAKAMKSKQQTMPMMLQQIPQPVARFEIQYHQVIDYEGTPVSPLPEIAHHPEQLINLYTAMVKTRLFDKKAVSLQRRGQLGTYASSMGQEAIGAAIGSIMKKEDVLFPAYREYAAQFLRGVKMSEILLYWGGNEQGMNFQGPRRDFPICVPIASQVPQAVGAAYAMQLRGELRVAVCVLGDGATSKGDFYESINAAGAWDLPIVFIVNNNRWAISLPLENQTRAQTLAQKAIAAGIAGEQVDGNDVIAMYSRLELAMEKARRGDGPTLIEALSYRLCDHTTADDASRYRSEKELTENWLYEPVKRLNLFLTQMGHWSKADEENLLSRCHDEIESEVKVYLNTPGQTVQSMFDYLYATLPASLEPQRCSASQEE